MGGHLLVASDVFKDGTDPDHIPLAAAQAVERADGFGRVFPQHKYEIVKSLQQLGHLVAMTGDGVNDAPALKQADCGVAVSGATDAARSAAALILTAPGLSTIVNAIVESRKIFERIQSYVYYRIAMTLDIMFVVVMSYVFFGFQPLTAIMIVALALLDDIPIMTIGYDNVLPAPKPVRWRMHRILVFSSLMGLLAIAQSFGLVLAGMEWMSDPELMDALRPEPVAPADHAVPAAGGRRPPAAVRRAHPPLDPGAAVPERALVPGGGGDADRGGADVRLRHPGAAAALGGDRRRLALCAGVDGGDRPRQAALRAHPGRPRGQGSRPPPADRRGAGDVNYTKKLMVEPGGKVRLEKFDPAFRGKHGDDQAAAKELEAVKAKLGDLQRKMYGDNRHSLLIVLQGLDAAGKDGVCWHVVSAMDPQGCKVQGFKVPTAEEAAHDFLWRIHPHAPAKGEVAVFNRSHYEDVLVTRVHKLVPRKVWERRYQLINDWERLLHEENGTTILKFCLVVSKEEQLRRFAERLDDPHRQWKISDSDYKERAFFDDYLAAFDEALERTSTEHAPWFTIPCDHKAFRNLAVARIVLDAMEGMKLKYPEPTVDLAQIRREYHAAAAEEAHPGR